MLIPEITKSPHFHISSQDLFKFKIPGFSDPLFTKIQAIKKHNHCSSVPNRRVGQNKRASGQILKKH